MGAGRARNNIQNSVGAAIGGPRMPELYYTILIYLDGYFKDNGLCILQHRRGRYRMFYKINIFADAQWAPLPKNNFIYASVLLFHPNSEKIRFFIKNFQKPRNLIQQSDT